MSVGGSSPGRRRLPFAARPQRGGGGGGGVRPAPCRGPPRRLGFLPRPAPPQTTPRPVGAGGSPRGRVARVAAPRGCVPRWWPAGRRGVLPPPRASPRAVAARCLVPPSPRGFGVAPGGWAPGFQPPVGRGASWPHTRVRLRGGREGEAGGAPGGPRRSGGDRRVFLLVAPSPAALLLLLRLSSAPRRVRSPRPVGSLGLVVVVRLSLPRPAPPARPRARRLVLPRAAARLCSLLPPTPGASPPLERVGAGWGGVGEPGGWRLDRGSVLARGSRTVSPSHLAGALFPARGRASERTSEGEPIGLSAPVSHLSRPARPPASPSAPPRRDLRSDVATR